MGMSGYFRSDVILKKRRTKISNQQGLIMSDGILNKQTLKIRRVIMSLQQISPSAGTAAGTAARTAARTAAEEAKH